MRPFALVLGGSLAISLLFLTLPVAAIFLDTSPAELWQSLGEEGALDALWLAAAPHGGHGAHDDGDRYGDQGGREHECQ